MGWGEQKSCGFQKAGLGGNAAGGGGLKAAVAAGRGPSPRPPSRRMTVDLINTRRAACMHSAGRMRGAAGATRGRQLLAASETRAAAAERGAAPRRGGDASQSPASLFAATPVKQPRSARSAALP